MGSQALNPDESQRWFRCVRPNPAARVRLYCVPFAGGGPLAFRGWPDHLPDVELWAVHLPGRESRMRESAFTDMNVLMGALTPAFEQHAEGDFCVFGHSLGAMIAFELTRRLESGSGRRPSHLFLSGHGAPSLYVREAPTHTLPHDAFKERIRSFDGTPDVVLQNEELMDIFLPLLRADIQMLETFERDPDSRVGCPIIALGAHDDPEVPLEAMEAWRVHTRSDFSIHAFEGGHFYWQQNPAPMLEAIRSSLHATP